MDPSNVGSGMIAGGWGYIWTVYGVSWAVFVVYTAYSLFERSRAQTQETPS